MARAGKVWFALLCLAVGLLWPSDTEAGDPKAPPSVRTDESSLILDVIAAGKAGTEPEVVSAEKAEPLTQSEKEVWAAYYAASKFSYENRKDAFRWQAVTTKIIFVVVILLVVFGSVLTALQFTRKLTAVTALKASTGGVEVTSPVVGVVILTLSLGFFYLYLANVYPINEVQEAGAKTSHKDR